MHRLMCLMITDVLCHLNVDGCVSELSTSAGGFSVMWPETDLGQTAAVLCPCADFSLGASHPAASRVCSGSFTNGAEWESASLDVCDFSSTTQALCNVSLVRLCALLKKALESVLKHPLF